VSRLPGSRGVGQSRPIQILKSWRCISRSYCFHEEWPDAPLKSFQVVDKIMWDYRGRLHQNVALFVDRGGFVVRPLSLPASPRRPTKISLKQIPFQGQLDLELRGTCEPHLHYIGPLNHMSKIPRVNDPLKAPLHICLASILKLNEQTAAV